MAYVLIRALRPIGPAHTEFAESTFRSIRLKLRVGGGGPHDDLSRLRREHATAVRCRAALTRAS